MLGLVAQDHRSVALALGPLFDALFTKRKLLFAFCR
jgi:hypothetical protein